MNYLYAALVFLWLAVFCAVSVVVGVVYEVVMWVRRRLS